MSSTIASIPPAAPEAVVPAEDKSAIHNSQAPIAIIGLRRAHLWAVIPFAIAWFAACIDVIEPFDFWWNVKSGQIMALSHQFLGTDVLAWSAVREPYSNPQWGSQILFYGIYNLSPYLLLTLRAAIITATVGILLWLCTWRSKSLRAGAIAALVAYFAAWTNYGMRPQLFAFLPFIGFLFLLERKDAYPRRLYLLVPLMIFWVNVHGSFFLGVALLGIYAFGTALEKIGSEDGRRWLRSKAALWQVGWFGAAALASVLNPYFVGIYDYFFIATNDPIARSLNVEWQPPTLSGGTGQLFYAQVVIFLASLYLSKRRLRPTELLLILAFGFLALTSLRNVIWWGWVTAPIMAANFAAWAEGRRRMKDEGLRTEDEGLRTTHYALRTREVYALNWLIAIILLGGALLFTPLWRQANPLVPAPANAALANTTPDKLAVFLENRENLAPIFNYMEWGGYLEWALYPKYQLFIDGRFEARQVQVWKDYLSVSRGRADWQKTLDGYGVRTLVLSKDFHEALIPFVEQSPVWRKIYEDKQALVFTR